VVAPVEEDLDALAVDADEHLVRVDLAAERGDAEDVVGHGALDRRCRAIPELISSDFKREDIDAEAARRGASGDHTNIKVFS